MRSCWPSRWPIAASSPTTRTTPGSSPARTRRRPGTAYRFPCASPRRACWPASGPQRNPCSRERLAGYRSCVRAAGLREVRLSADFTRPGAARAARRLLEAAPDLDAIFVASDLMATAVLQVLIASGRRVPDDVAVVGFDDSPPAWMTAPALSTVHQPVENLAALAVRTLTNRADSAPLDQRLPTHLVVRASSEA